MLRPLAFWRSNTSRQYSSRSRLLAFAIAWSFDCGHRRVRRRGHGLGGVRLLFQNPKPNLKWLTDRWARIGLAANLKTPTTRQVTVQRMKGLPASLRRSVTFDNGKEFAEHQQLSRSPKLEVYFALPYRSWQRGTNHKTNGLLRQFFPKGTEFSRIVHQEVARVEQLLNERPRKRLGYRTPSEILRRRLCRN